MNTSQFWGGDSVNPDLGDEIFQSLRFDGLSSQIFTRAQTGTNLASNKNFTFSTWFKHGDGGESCIFGVHAGSPENWLLNFRGYDNDTYMTFDSRHINDGVTLYDSNIKFRDVTAWYHLFLTCTNGTLRLRVNNHLTNTAVTQSTGYDRNLVLGSESTGGSTPADMYLAETYFIQDTPSGNDAETDGFIRLNDKGIYVPDTPTITTWGDNGFYLKYDPAGKPGQTGDGATIGADHSPNNNHFTATGFNTTAISSSNFDNDIEYRDVPTNNAATLPPYIENGRSSVDVREGGLGAVSDANGSWRTSLVDQAVSSGKWYYELEDNSTSPECFISFGPEVYYDELTNWNNVYPGASGGPGWSFYTYNGNKYFNGSASSYGTGGSTGSIYMIAFDADTGTAWIGRDGTWLNSATVSDIENGITTNAMFTGQYSGQSWRLGASFAYPGHADMVLLNFGQRDYVYTPPSGYQRLLGNNHEEPTIKDGREHHETIIYTGDNTNGRSFTSLKFQPDFVWIKDRNGGDNHRLVNSAAGVSECVASNSSTGSIGSPIASFDSNGFTLNNANSGWNGSSSINYVAWCWKGGGQPATDNVAGAGAVPTAGSVKIDGANQTTALAGATAIRRMSANTAAGFSAIEYQGNSGTATTIAHGLTEAPEFIMAKRFAVTESWVCYHKDAGPSKYINLDNTSGMAWATSTAYWTGTDPSNTVINLGTASGVNANSPYHMYCWHSVPGYSKIDSYVANNSDPGPYVHLGFKPAWIMFFADPAASAKWRIVDCKRAPHNLLTGIRLIASDSAAETLHTNEELDIFSNGFRVRGSSNSMQAASGARVYYMAFAQHPAIGDNTTPATAV